MRMEDVYELNEENVGKFLKYCLAKPDDPKEDYLIAFCYVDENGKVNPRTRANFSKKRYEKQEDRIVSMLGQLKKVHENNDKHTVESNILDFIDLQTKYDGTRWTKDPDFTVYLFLLGNAGNYFYALQKGKDGIYRTDLRDAAEVIEPMESPNDPKLVKRFPSRREPADDK